jgi:hypothetical protein
VKFDDSLTEQLSRIADEPAPPSAVDLERAVADARRAKSRRRAGGAASGTVAIALAAALFIPTSSGGSGAPVGTGQQPTVSPSATAALSGTDPATAQATFSMLPSGFVFGDADVYAAGANTGKLEDLTAYDTATDQGITLTLPPPGPTPPVADDNGGGLATPVSAPLVGPDQALWYSAPGTTEAYVHGVELAWEITPNQWVMLDLYGPDTSTAITGLVYQLAEWVQLRPAMVYPLPLHLTPPPGLPFLEADYANSPPDQSGVKLSFGTPDASVSVGGMVSISVGQTWPVGAGDGSPTALASATVSTTTVNGCAVTLTAAVNDEVLQAPGCDGLEIQINAVGTAVQALQEQGGILGFFRSITWLGSDPANWTTHVLG